MWRLHRYLFLTTALIALASVGVLVLLIVAGNLFRDLFDAIDEGQVGMNVITQLIPDLVLFAISVVTPFGTLIAVLAVVGRLSASSELTALKASGISLWRVSAPLVLLCLLGTGFAAWINSTVAPSARASYRDFLRDAILADPLRVIVAKQFIHDFQGYVVYLDEEHNGLIRDVWIWELDEEKRPVRLLRADAGTLTYDADRDALILKLEKGFVELRDEDNPNDLSRIQPSLFFDNLTIRLPLGDLMQSKGPARVRVVNLPFDQKRDRLVQLQRRLRDAPAEEVETIEKNIMEVKFQIQSSFANAFSVLSLGLLAIPLGVKASRRETTINLFIAIGLAVLYYTLTVMIGWLEDNPAARPDLLIWSPNILAQGLAAWLLVRVNRH